MSTALALRGPWHGFASIDCPVEAGRPPLSAAADYLGPDDNPTPVVVILQRKSAHGGGLDLIDLTSAELRWIVEHAPAILARMAARP